MIAYLLEMLNYLGLGKNLEYFRNMSFKQLAVYMVLQDMRSENMFCEDFSEEEIEVIKELGERRNKVV